MSDGPTPSTPPSPSGPGETAPRMLSRPPGERYQPSLARGATPSTPVRAHTGRAFTAALVVALGVAALTAVLLSAFDARWPVLIVAGIGGWLIGAVAWMAAWHGTRPITMREARIGAHRVTMIAIGVALLAWLVGEIGAWLVSLWQLPNSALSFPDRLAAVPFVDWLSPQFGPLELMEILLLVGLAWFAARAR